VPDIDHKAKAQTKRATQIAVWIMLHKPDVDLEKMEALSQEDRDALATAAGLKNPHPSVTTWSMAVSIIEMRRAAQKVAETGDPFAGLPQ
jgi:adenine C2-methylase RlmN of 23S rRNA A2503 and tRNA A37